MHVLTKIFIVLVTLLAVALVPLVVVYAYNESSYQGRYSATEAQVASAQQALETAEARFGAELTRKEAQIQELMNSNRMVARDKDELEAEVSTLTKRLAAAEQMDQQIAAKLNTLATALEQGQDFTERLVGELSNIRQQALAAQREKVELDEALREKQAQYDVAVAARRALEEELQRVREENATALETIEAYVAEKGPLSDDVSIGGFDATPGHATPDHDLVATVLGTTRSQDQVLAEIDAGSRDGVEVNWSGTIGSGGDFIGRLIITRVDINRSTGRVELEDPATRGRVEEGQKVYFRSR